jgi:cytochrome P450
MDAVFNETLRLYGPGNYIFPRSAPDGKLSILDVQFPK